MSEPTFLSHDDPREVIKSWMQRHDMSYRKVCMKLGMSGPGRLANLLSGKDRFSEGLVPSFVQLMSLSEAEAKTREATLMKRFQRVKQRLFQMALEEGLVGPGDAT